MYAAGIRTLSTASVLSLPTKLRCESSTSLCTEYGYGTEIRALAVGSTVRILSMLSFAIVAGALCVCVSNNKALPSVK